MKRLFLFTLSALCLTALMQAGQIRVLSDRYVADGWHARMMGPSTVMYSTVENADYLPSEAESATYACEDEELRLCLYQDGHKRILAPAGTEVNYVWVSLSPDGKRILYNTKFGTAICDLQGRELVNFGRLDAPVWYGNDYVVGMRDEDDSHNYTSSCIVIAAADGSMQQDLTAPAEFGMYPSVLPEYGQIAYNTLDGQIRLLQLNLSEQPVDMNIAPKAILAQERQIQRAPSYAAAKAAIGNMKPADVRIYINPGHGGHDSDDRNITIYPFKQGDPNGFWESNSNLDKGLKLNEWLKALGFQTKMSRITNTTADDRALSAIVAEANAYRSNFMLSIHSNAGGTSNMVLMLYAGKDENDTHSYIDVKDPTTEKHSRDISTMIGNYLYENKITTWATAPRIVGDKTFGRTAMGWSNGYGVLRNLTVPGVISEGCMHDYIPETYRLMNMDYKYKESWYFMRVFCEYFCGIKQTTGVIAGQVRDQFNKQEFPVFNKIKNSRDQYLALDRATVRLLRNNVEIGSYVTDTLYNGVFFFWNLEPGQYTLRADVDHYYVMDTVVEVVANEMTYQDMFLQKKRENRPEVLSYSPHVASITDSVNVAEPIILNFNYDMWEEPTRAAFSIVPAVEGTLTFTNSQRTLTFTPKTVYEPGTEYTVTLAKTAAHPDTHYPNTLTEDFVFRFRTKNRPNLSVKLTYPADGETGIALKPSIYMLFDEKLSSASTYKLFTVKDDGTFSFTPASRTFKKNSVESPYGSASFDVSTELQPNTRYTVVIDATVKDTDNIMLMKPYTFSFTTGDATVEKEGEVINSMDAVAFEIDADKTNGLEDKTLSTGGTSIRTEGQTCNSISYKFSKNEPDAICFLKPLDLTQIFRSVDKFIIDVYGDFSMNELYAEFSTEGDIHRYKVCTLDFIGWRYCVIDLQETDLPTGVEFNFTGLVLMKTQQQPILCNSGKFYLDRLARVQGEWTALPVVEANADATGKHIVDGHLLITTPNKNTYDAKGAMLK